MYVVVSGRIQISNGQYKLNSVILWHQCSRPCVRENAFSSAHLLFQDLVSRILDFIEFRGIRMMDFFRAMDKDGKMMITKEQFNKGLEVAEIPASKAQLDRLFSLLDEQGTGFAKYRDFAKVLHDNFHEEFAKKRSNNNWDH